MKVFEVVVHYYSYIFYYIVQAENQELAIDSVLSELVSTDKDNVTFDVTEIDLSKPHFVAEV